MRVIAILAGLTFTTLMGATAQVAPPPMQHTPGMVHSGDMDQDTPPAKARESGQAAFAAISEVVALLEADPTTDWSRVDIEALRQHLLDMDAVTMRARVAQRPISGGLSMEITGDASVAASIRRMVTAHAPMLTALGGWTATATAIPGGTRLTVIAPNRDDTRTTARIRGLGFIGLMTEGAHHAVHHLAIARGEGAHAHTSPQ